MRGIGGSACTNGSKTYVVRKVKVEDLERNCVWGFWTAVGV